MPDNVLVPKLTVFGLSATLPAPIAILLVPADVTTPPPIAVEFTAAAVDLLPIAVALLDEAVEFAPTAVATLMRILSASHR